MYACIWTYISICICICVYIYVDVDVDVDTFICLYEYLYVYFLCSCICTCLCLHVYTHIYIYIFVYVYICICICICLCLYVYVFVYVYVYVYFHMCVYVYLYICTHFFNIHVIVKHKTFQQKFLLREFRLAAFALSITVKVSHQIFQAPCVRAEFILYITMQRCVSRSSKRRGPRLKRSYADVTAYARAAKYRQ